MAVGERAAVVIVDGDRVLLMHRRKGEDDYYTVPGGSIEPGGSPEEEAVREAKEETGLTVTLREKLGVLDDGVRRGHYYLVTGFAGTRRVGGPERDRMSPTNRYDLEWIEARRLRSVDLRSAGVVGLCERAVRLRGVTP